MKSLWPMARCGTKADVAKNAAVKREKWKRMMGSIAMWVIQN